MSKSTAAAVSLKVYRRRKAEPGPKRSIFTIEETEQPAAARKMRAISLVQPWAWLVVNGYKTFENRTRQIAPPGVYYVHASRTLVEREWDKALYYAGKHLHREELALIPDSEDMERGGIVGSMVLGEWSP